MRFHMTATGLAAIFLAGAGTLWAQQPLANVSSPSPFTLRGVTVNPGQGVASWPVMAGDTLKAGSAPVSFSFAGGSIITLAPGAEAKVDLMGGKPMFQLIAGSARYNLSSPGAVGLQQGGKIVSASSQSGVLTLGTLPAAAGTGGGGGTGGFWTGAHTALVVVGIAAATGASVGIAEAVSGGSSTSPH